MTRRVQRFAPDFHLGAMELQPTGDWVRWDDALGLLQEVERLRREADQVRRGLAVTVDYMEGLNEQAIAETDRARKAESQLAQVRKALDASA